MVFVFQLHVTDSIAVICIPESLLIQCFQLHVTDSVGLLFMVYDRCSTIVFQLHVTDSG